MRSSRSRDRRSTSGWTQPRGGRPERRTTLGYAQRIPPQRAPFDSHGQDVFSNGKRYITRDIDGHNTSNCWKVFNKQGERIGTFDSELNYIKH
ncbi:toxin C-terminal domain-containing protein [Luteimicrobium subarcticum]|uniref:toxin C-terminal domain-containing protein n=1 Tax=Luteimicrobium subarcticum TaxID=620910 RepID=UPI000C234C3D